MTHHLKALFINWKMHPVSSALQSKEEALCDEESKLCTKTTLVEEEVNHLLREKAKILHTKGLRPCSRSLNIKLKEINRKLEVLRAYQDKVEKIIP